MSARLHVRQFFDKFSGNAVPNIQKTGELKFAPTNPQTQTTMSKISSQERNMLAQKRLLTFVNRLFQVEQVQRLLEGYTSSQDYGIGDITVQKIVARRQDLPSKRYESLDQLGDIEGLGPDKMQELLEVFQYTAAEDFHKRMRRSVIPGNFILNHHDIQYETDESFQVVACQDGLLRDHIAAEVQRISALKYGNELAARLASRLIYTTYLDRIEPEYTASYAWATWFYKFDADNWFGFEQVRQACALYLEGLGQYETGNSLILFRGFNLHEVLAQSVTVVDLPVVLQADERRISIWTAQLND